jgi:hypothetical protein
MQAKKEAASDGPEKHFLGDEYAKLFRRHARLKQQDT